MYLTSDDVKVIACPSCGGPLRFEGRVAQERMHSGVLACHGCGRNWPVRRGLAWLYEESWIRGLDWFLRPIYDVVAPFHDLGVNFTLPLLQFPDPDATRLHYVERLELGRLQPNPQTPLRILEVGIGAGANLELIEDALPGDLPVELWGIDYSWGMMRQCEINLRRHPPQRRVRLLYADAHVLPFRDATFDRVFHVGAINGYHDRGRALAEMARVARPGTPIVVVDEELDPRRPHSLLHRLAFWSLTAYDPNPRAPRDQLPANAINVQESAVSRFYYCLRFEMPAAR